MPRCGRRGVRVACCGVVVSVLTVLLVLVAQQQLGSLPRWLLNLSGVGVVVGLSLCVVGNWGIGRDEVAGLRREVSARLWSRVFPPLESLKHILCPESFRLSLWATGNYKTRLACIG